MLVGCLWQNDHLVTVSLGGTISLFPSSNLEKSTLQLSGHMKNITSLAVLKSDPNCILSSSYDGLIVKWVQGLGYCGKLQRRENSQIKCFAAAEEEIVTSGFENKVKLRNMLYHTARINCLAWSPNSCMVAKGSLDTCVIIYEFDQPASSRMTIKGAHLGRVYGMVFTDEFRVVSSGENACLRVWKLSPQ